MSARGFVLLEWLVAASLTIAIAGAVFAAVVPVRDVIERTQHRTDLATAARGAVDSIVNEMREAGSGASISEVPANALNPLPSFEVLDDLASGNVVATGTALRVRRTPHGAPQGRLGNAVPAGAQVLPLETAFGCASGAPSCGFDVGDRALLVMPGGAEIVAVQGALPGAVVLTAGVPGPVPAGTVLSKLVTTTFGLKTDGVPRVVRLTDGGAEQPLVDQVVEFEVSRVLANPPHLSVRLRVQAADARLRGPAGYLFTNAGTASSPRQWLPDIELRAHVTLRNGGELP
jgi:hypothetical protein